MIFPFPSIYHDSGLQKLVEDLAIKSLGIGIGAILTG